MNKKNSNPMLTHPFQVKRIQKETHDTFTLELKSANGRFSFEPGQFNMLYVFGVGEVPISISGDPASKGSLTHTTRAVGAVTQAIRKIGPGHAIGVRGPFGSHWPVREAKSRDVVIVAGGIGLAPLRPALYQLLSKRSNYRRIALLYGARTPEEILYRKELKKWAGELDLDVHPVRGLSSTSNEVHVTVDRASGTWRGNVGVVTTLIPRAPFEPANTIAMVCGPEIMMRFTVQELRKRGIPDERIYVSMERNMKCAIGFCGHCQFGPAFICKDGPIFSFNRISSFFGKPEL
jgi:NAD(P)H-flavin reductase